MRSSHHIITQQLPPVSTGLEVVWGENPQGTKPERLFFGCYGEIDGLGNLTTANADGTIHQTMHGAHAGTILLGPQVPPLPAPMGDYIPPDMELSQGGAGSSLSVSEHKGGHGIAIFVLSLFMIVAVHRRCRKYWKAKQHRYSMVNHECYDFVGPSTEVGPTTVSYVELR